MTHELSTIPPFTIHNNPALNSHSSDRDGTDGGRFIDHSQFTIAHSPPLTLQYYSSPIRGRSWLYIFYRN